MAGGRHCGTCPSGILSDGPDAVTCWLTLQIRAAECAVGQRRGRGMKACENQKQEFD